VRTNDHHEPGGHEADCWSASHVREKDNQRDLDRKDKLAGVYCNACGRERDVPPSGLGLPMETPVPKAGWRFVYSPCSGRNVTVMSELYPGGVEAMRRRHLGNRRAHQRAHRRVALVTIVHRNWPAPPVSLSVPVFGLPTGDSGNRWIFCRARLLTVVIRDRGHSPLSGRSDYCAFGHHPPAKPTRVNPRVR
jgi:hypothetical protein